MSMNIKVFTCYHKQYDIADGDVIFPIHVGKACSSAKLNMQGDDTGENISVKNPYYCELTALYWAWKNSDADAIGLFHYRRFLNFKNRKTKWSQITDLCKKFGIDSSHIQPLLMENDIILPQKTKRTLPLYENYDKHHIITDLDLALDILQEDYSDMFPVAQTVLKQQYGYFTNIFIARRDLFNEYCEWIFDILSKIESKIHEDVVTRETYQQRVYGFLSERLMSIFIEYKKQTSDIKIVEVPTIFIDEPRKIFESVKTVDKTRWYLFGLQIFKSVVKDNKITFYILGIPVFNKKR